jgi:hypothetical protein
MQRATVAVKLQKKFLLKKFLSEIKKKKPLFDKLNSFTTLNKNLLVLNKDAKFDELRKLLINKKYMQDIDKILNYHYRCYGVHKNIAPKLNSRLFLVSWMLVSFPEFMMDIPDPSVKEVTSSQMDQYPYDIYYIMKDFIFYVNLLCNNDINDKEILRKFKKMFNKYSNAVTYFLSRDKSEQIQKLLNEFVNINKTIMGIKNSKKYDDEQKEESIKVITETKKKVANHLTKLDSGINLNDLEIQSQVHDSIEKNMEKAMHDILVLDIQNKKFSYFSKFIDDITDHLTKLGAHKIDTNFKDKIDKDFIIQKMTYLSMEHTHIHSYGDYLVHIINNLQAPVSVDDTKANWENMKQEIDCKHQLLGKLVIFILQEIKIIYETIANIDTLMNNELLGDQ